MSRPTAPFYDYDDVKFVKPYYLTAGLGLVDDFVRGHSAGEILPPNWLGGRPACADADPEVFYPGKGDHYSATLAKRICRNCPCIEACKEHSIDERHGVWGGLTETDRRVLRVRRKLSRT
jgi:hypothetical protein